MNKLITLACLSVAVTACTDKNGASVTAPVAAPNASVAYLTLSNSQPAKGSVITVTVHAIVGEGAEALGSFTARLQLGAGLEYVEETPVTDGMHALRVSADTIIVAGASSSGYSDSRLFAVKARVLDPALLSSVALSFSEANSVHFANQSRSLKIDHGVFVAK